MPVSYRVRVSVQSLARYFQRLKMWPISSLDGGWMETPSRGGTECRETLLLSGRGAGARTFTGEVADIQALRICNVCVVVVGGGGG